jgi:hypothetical protein
MEIRYATITKSHTGPISKGSNSLRSTTSKVCRLIDAINPNFRCIAIDTFTCPTYLDEIGPVLAWRGTPNVLRRAFGVEVKVEIKSPVVFVAKVELPSTRSVTITTTSC